jgi:pyridinium-3,5-biscarboxylic acid mononucleotide sulfurtransferase
MMTRSRTEKLVASGRHQKTENLIKILKDYNAIVIAFSGGVDSALLLALAAKTVKKKVLAVTADTPFFPKRELRAAESFAHRLGIQHVVLPINLMQEELIVANNKNRCYHCKRSIILAMKRIAKEYGIDTITHGANIDDLGDFRPGLTAADELGVIAPFIEAGFTKADIRMLSWEMNLETWQKPAMSCLATRIPYNTPITTEALKQIEQAEEVMQTLGFETCRVRHHGNLARIEVAPEALSQVLSPETRADILRLFRMIGYLHISLDLEGYTPGRMNRELETGSPLSKRTNLSGKL